MLTAQWIRPAARRLLSAPFQPVDLLHQPFETFQDLGEHESRFAEDAWIDPALSGRMPTSWRTRRFTYDLDTRLLLDTGLGWTMRGTRLLAKANYAMVQQLARPILPNALKWLRATVTAERRGKVVWLPFGAGNYFHCLNDLIGGLALLRDRVHQLPVLVDAGLLSQPFFRELCGYSTFLSELNWVPYQAGRWIRCEGLLTAGTYFCAWPTLADAIGLLDRLPDVEVAPRGKLFISRAAGTQRSPNNLEALDRFFAARGFEVALFERMTVQQQRQAINSARVIAAVHGAALTNLAFHEAPAEATLIEIMPSDYLNPCFGFLAGEIGMRYHCLAAGARDPEDNFSFRVPMEELERQIDGMSLD